ncbi:MULTISPECIES: helix-turn-helix domain-containing protein [unclassified Butyrivibrio]|uniref:helix-turn-helix domain-containing protein n=1 Tax=unclassified Butyrivibrio TaxID=2639466 RepID=UPI00041258F7|nr:MULTISPECIES: helix-turn-helix transcriptional regulator [unclassified Butyrivibrio]
MKDFCGKKVNCKEMSVVTQIPYSTLNDIVNGKTDPGQMRFSYAKKIADYLGVSLDELYESLNGCHVDLEIDGGEIIVRNKSYYLRCQAYADKLVRLCKVNKTNSYFVRDVAKWKIEELREEAEWENVKQRFYSDAQG